MFIEFVGCFAEFVVCSNNNENDHAENECSVHRH